MAIFEQRLARKVELDDTQTLTCLIENWRNVNRHTEFIIKVQRGPISDNCWRIYKRYNDFHKLHLYLQTSGLDLQLPPKKLIGNMDSEFISERLQGLQKYLNQVLMNPILISSLPARSFIDPANYCQPFGELALQHVSLALRGEMGWEVVGPLEEMGWRLRKHFYQVRCKSLPKEDLMGAWTDYGPDKYLGDKDMHVMVKCLCQIRHPFVHGIELSLCTDIGSLVVRTAHKDGSLRDVLYGAKPRQSFLKKYGNPKGHKALEVAQVALYGRQILEALKFLMEKGIPYGHLHTGNVIIDDNNRVKLLDIENGILGVPSFYRPYFIQHRKINTMEAVDVYCFGHTLYEMTFGTPLQESVADNIPNCAPVLKSVLESILSSEAFKSGLPTIQALITLPFFSTVALDSQLQDMCHLKIPNSTRDHLKSCMGQIEDRLREEQKTIRSQKRLVRVQEMMSSEEEKKKHKSKQRQEHKQAKQKTKEAQMLLQDKLKRGGSKESDSVNSSGNTSLGTATPPSYTGPSAPPPPPPPPPQTQNNNGVAVIKDRSALLGEICNFNVSLLRKSQINHKPA